MDRLYGTVTLAIKSGNDDAEAGSFSGYGSVFGNLDSYREIVDPGAFTASLADINASGDPIPVLWQHEGSDPIGGMTASEDLHGLACTGQLMVGDPTADRARKYMKARIVRGMSIGYQVEDAIWNEKTGVRHLKTVSLMEVSIVTFPANAAATVNAIKRSTTQDESDNLIQRKFASDEVPTVEEFVLMLRKRGCAPELAKAIANGGIAPLQPRVSSPFSSLVADLRATMGVA